jgi:hypothetical protein
VSYIVLVFWYSYIFCDVQERSTISAFRAVGSQNIVNSPAVKPGLVPLASGRSPQVARRWDSSDQVSS